MAQITISPAGWQIIRDACEWTGGLPLAIQVALQAAAKHAHAQMRQSTHAEQRESFRAHGLSTFHCDIGSCPHCRRSARPGR